MKPTLAAPLGFALVYAIFAFALWQFNPALWSGYSRGLMALTGSFVSGMAALWFFAKHSR